jgi:hypothetical protein
MATGLAGPESDIEKARARHQAVDVAVRQLMAGTVPLPPEVFNALLALQATHRARSSTR